MIVTTVWQLLRQRRAQRRRLCPWCGQDHGTPTTPAPLRDYPTS